MLSLDFFISLCPYSFVPVNGSPYMPAKPLSSLRGIPTFNIVQANAQYLRHLPLDPIAGDHEFGKNYISRCCMRDG